MRWSGAIRLHEFRAFRPELDGREGIYEIGYVKGDYFYPKYVGKTVNLYIRMTNYNNPNVCHNAEIANRLFSEYRNIWMHYIRVGDSAWSESRLQHHYKIGDTGLYQWNERRENAYRVRPSLR